MKQKIAAQLFTIREQVKTQDDLRDAASRLASIGYTYVQFSGINISATAEQVRGIFDDAGLKICCSHMPWERLQNDLDAVAKENLQMGCPIVGVSSIPNTLLDTTEEVMAAAEKLKSIGKQLRAYGLQFALHNHWNEFHKIQGKTALEMIMESTEPEELELILCCYWAQHAGADPIEMLHRYRGRITCCHYKDKVMINGQPTFAEVGQGNMNYPTIFKACEETGIQYAIMEQDVCRRDPFESLAMSRAYVLSLDKADV